MLTGREEPLKWLNRNTKLSRLCSISGVKGVGKTSLVVEWLKKSQLRFSWKTCERFQNLSAQLSKPEKNYELALQEAATEWIKYDVIVWDDFQNLGQQFRQVFTSFIQANPFLPIFIFISDQNLSKELGPQIPSLQLKPLNRDEIKLFCENLNEDFTDIELSRIEKITGGLPLLINLWLQNQNSSNIEFFYEKVIESLSPEAKEILDFSLELKGSFSIQALKKLNLFSRLDQAMTELIDKFLVQKNPEKSDYYFNPGYISQALKGKVPEDKIKDAVVKYMISNGEASSYLHLLVFAIQNKNREVIDSYSSKTSPQALESLSQEDLLSITQVLENFNYSEYEITVQLRLYRIIIKAYFLAGERQKAIDLSSTVCADFITGDILNQEQQEFLLEYIQLLNRSNKTSIVHDLCSHWLGKCTGKTKILLLIELGSSYVNSDPSRSISVLERACEKVDNSNIDDKVFISGLAYFDIARSLSGLQKKEAAQDRYQQAYDCFSESKRSYYAAVTLFNITWMNLEAREWDSLNLNKTQLFKLSNEFGYKYVKAGLHLIEAIQARLFYQNNLALDSIDKAQLLLGSSSPIVPFLDLNLEKMTLLGQTSLYKEIPPLAETIDKKVSQLDSNPFKEKIERHKHISLSHLYNTEQLLEPINIEGASEDELIVLLKRGLINLSLSQQIKLKKHPRGRVAILCSQVLEHIKNKSLDELWRDIQVLEEELSHINDICEEKIALQLLQAELTTDESLKTSYIKKVKINLLRWGCDSIAKAPLEAWLESLQNNYSRPDKNPRWKKSYIGDQEKWIKWWRPLLKTEKTYKLLSNYGEKEISEVAPPAKGLFINSELREVYFNGQLLNEFAKKNSLRRLLTCLLDSFPLSLDKNALSSLVWGESYNPTTHDARIYTSVQRIRSLLNNPDLIICNETGYSWNPRFSFQILRPQGQSFKTTHRVQTLILQALSSSQESGKEWVSRSELVELTQSSDATIKREIAKLLSQAAIIRKGKGRSVTYTSA